MVFERTDQSDPLAPGPARVVMWVPDGAPFALRMPVSVQRGSASAEWLSVAVGDTAGEALVVKRDAGRKEAVQLSFGPPPRLSQLLNRYFGLEVVPEGQMALFAESENRSPVFREAIPGHWLRVGGPSAEVVLAPYFVDPDGDSLTYGVTTGDGSMVGGRTESGVLWMEPLAEGETELEVTATDGEGLRAVQRVPVTVAPTTDPDAFNIELIFRPGFPEEQKQVIVRAAGRWEEVVTGDLPDVPIDGYMDYRGSRSKGSEARCGPTPGPRLVGSVDDVVIRMYDGFGGSSDFAATAGTCGSRAESGLAFGGRVTYNESYFRPGGDGLDELYATSLHEIRTRPGDRHGQMARHNAENGFVAAGHLFSGPAGGRGVQRGGRPGVRGRQGARPEHRWRGSVALALRRGAPGDHDVGWKGTERDHGAGAGGPRVRGG